MIVLKNGSGDAAKKIVEILENEFEEILEYLINWIKNDPVLTRKIINHVSVIPNTEHAHRFKVFRKQYQFSLSRISVPEFDQIEYDNDGRKLYHYAKTPNLLKIYMGMMSPIDAWKY